MKIKITDALRDMFEDLTVWQRFGVIAGALLFIALVIFGASALSSWRIHSLEKDVAAAKERASAFEKRSDEAEKTAAKYSEKITFLETNLTEIQKLARTQDENLQKFSSVVDGARSDAERARGVRSIASTADDLCRRLEEVGHPCQ